MTCTQYLAIIPARNISKFSKFQFLDNFEISLAVLLPNTTSHDITYTNNNNNNLSSKIKTAIQHVFISKKLKEDHKVREVKPAILNQQCLVYKFQCNLCNAGYVSYTRGHLHERVDGHRRKSSSICKHYFSEHKSNVPPCFLEQFHVLTKCFNKLIP